MSSKSNAMTRIQRDMLATVSDRGAQGYPPDNRNETRTLRALRSRGLVTRLPDTEFGHWFLTDAGIEIVAAWGSAGCM